MIIDPTRRAAYFHLSSKRNRPLRDLMYDEKISNACFVINASPISDGNYVVDSENVWWKSGSFKRYEVLGLYILNIHIRDMLAGNLSWPSDKSYAGSTEGCTQFTQAIRKPMRSRRDIMQNNGIVDTKIKSVTMIIQLSETLSGNACHIVSIINRPFSSMSYLR